MRILVVDDEPAIRFSLTELLEAEGHEVEAAEHAPAALSRMEARSFDLVLADLTMPAMSGLELLEEVRARHPSSVFVLVTAHGDERTAVRALRAGAYDYLPKPFDNDEARIIVARVREMLALRRENERLRAELADRRGRLIGGSEAMRAVYRVIERVAPTDATVLVTGESGTGKELVAREIHEASRRRARPFVALNCAALPAELIESELFGHAKGAFTGADRAREGLFEAADGGTLFLDEVGDLASPAQAKLLRALEERAVTRLGESDPRPVDVRIIAATHRPLERMVAEGTFRDDLLYRLRVVSIEVPPLRERREDILPIAVHLAVELGERHRRPIRDLSDEARRRILAYDWPGNVRELRNALERAIVLGDGETVEAADLPPRIRDARSPLRHDEAILAGLPYTEARARVLRGFERGFLTAALERNDGNISATARALGLHRQSLQKMLRRLAEENG